MYDASTILKNYKDFSVIKGVVKNMRSSGDNLMSVGEVSRALGITRRIILNYEDKGRVHRQPVLYD